MIQPLLRSSFLKQTLLLATAGLACTMTQAQTVTIYRGGSMITPTYTTISDAVAAAMAGDSLAISAGHFNEHDITINKSLVLAGSGAATDTTVLDANGSGRGIHITGGNVTLRNLLIQNGKITNNAGGGVVNFGSGKLTLSGKTAIRKNQCTGIYANGGGVFSSGQVVMTDDAMIADNFSTETGGGIYAADTIWSRDRASITGNITSGSGGGIFNTKDGGLEIGGFSSIKNNQAAAAGGGAYGTGRIHDYAMVSNNTADFGGGIACLNTELALADSAIIAGNTATTSGGAIWLNNTSMTATGNFRIINNRIPAMTGTLNFGGAIYNVNGSLNIFGGRITGNQSPTAAIYSTSGAAPTLLSFNQTYIYNPSYSGARQPELINRPSMSSSLINVTADACWWGSSDTSGLIYNYAGASLVLNSWVKAMWTVNNGAPVDLTTHAFPVTATFALNDGSGMDTTSLRALTGMFSASAGAFSGDSISISLTNDITAIYMAPAVSDTVTLMGVVDADTFRQRLYVTSGLGIKETGAASAIKIYPNPATAWLHIDGLQQNTAIMLYHTDGRLVLQQTAAAGTTQLSLQSLPPGTYVLQLALPDGSKTARQVIKQ